jgi:hypothetical protein
MVRTYQGAYSGISKRVNAPCYSERLGNVGRGSLHLWAILLCAPLLAAGMAGCSGSSSAGPPGALQRALVSKAYNGNIYQSADRDHQAAHQRTLLTS